jgi:hypothetical protein
VEKSTPPSETQDRVCSQPLTPQSLIVALIGFGLVLIIGIVLAVKCWASKRKHSASAQRDVETADHTHEKGTHLPSRMFANTAAADNAPGVAITRNNNEATRPPDVRTVSGILQKRAGEISDQFRTLPSRRDRRFSRAHSTAPGLSKVPPALQSTVLSNVKVKLPRAPPLRPLTPPRSTRTSPSPARAILTTRMPNEHQNASATKRFSTTSAHRSGQSFGSSFRQTDHQTDHRPSLSMQAIRVNSLSRTPPPPLPRKHPPSSSQVESADSATHTTNIESGVHRHSLPPLRALTPPRSTRTFPPQRSRTPPAVKGGTRRAHRQI